MKRRQILAACLATGAILTAGTVVPVDTAQASTPSGSSSASTAVALPGNGISVQTSFTGLLGLLSPILSGVVTPLLNTVAALPSQVLTGVAQAIGGVGLTATNTINSLALPATQSGFPTNCTSGGWTTTNCFGPILPTISLAPLLSLGTGLAQGYAAVNSTGYISRTQITDPNITVLGLPIGDLGVIGGQAFCGSAAGTCQATESFTGASLFGGVIRLQLANNSNLLSVSIENGPWTNVSDLSGSLKTINDVLGLDSNHDILSIKASGSLLTIQGKLDLQALLSGIGLGGLLSGISGIADANTVGQLTLTLGPGQNVTSTSTQSWGLELGLDLSGTISLSLLGGLAGVTIGIPTNITSTSLGNLLDLKLAYANATSGAVPANSTQWVPPGLT